jgi:hypothetical protein
MISKPRKTRCKTGRPPTPALPAIQSLQRIQGVLQELETQIHIANKSRHLLGHLAYTQDVAKAAINSQLAIGNRQ